MDRIDGFENIGSIGCSQGIDKQAIVFMGRIHESHISAYDQSQVL